MIRSTRRRRLGFPGCKSVILSNHTNKRGKRERGTLESWTTVTYDSSSPDFIPYDELTQDDVLNWVWTQVDKNQVEARLAQDIYDQEHPQTASGLPWV